MENLWNEMRMSFTIDYNTILALNHSQWNFFQILFFLKWSKLLKNLNLTAI